MSIRMTAVRMWMSIQTDDATDEYKICEIYEYKKIRSCDRIFLVILISDRIFSELFRSVLSD